MEDKPTYGKLKPEINFANLNPEENHLANTCLNDLRDYLDVISENDRFECFFDLFNKLCRERISSILLPFLLALSISCNAQNANPYKVKVIGIKDGDSIEVLDEDKKLNFVVRLAEIDCPEHGQSFGKNAKQFTSNLVFGMVVNLIITDTDRYGRYIGEVYIENSYLSAELVKNGLAWVYRRYSDNEELVKLEEQAKSNRVGLWSEPDPVQPWEWRKSN